MPYLIYHTQNGKETVQLKESLEFSIGRTQDNDITVLNDPSVSRRHCVFLVNSTEKKFVVRDMNSSNGTYVNNQLLSGGELSLEEGDRILVGNAEFIFCTENPERYQTTSTTIIKFGKLSKEEDDKVQDGQDTVKMDRQALEEEMKKGSLKQIDLFGPSAIPPGTDINGYKVIRSLGGGSLATVYLAYQASVKRTIAVKIFSISASDEAKDAFMAQIRKVSGMNHPNLVPFFDGGTFGSFCYLVTAYMPEGNLKERISRNGPLSERDALVVAGKMADALNYSNSEFGVAHQNLNSKNVLFSDSDEPAISAAGLSGWAAKYMQSGRAFFFGDPAYMSPEQAAGESATWSGDLYSLGIILYEMIAGRPPFPSDNPQELVLLHKSSKITCPQNFSREAASLISGMTSKQPFERFQSWQAFSKSAASLIESKGRQLQPAKQQNRAPVKFTAGASQKKIILKK